MNAQDCKESPPPNGHDEDVIPFPLKQLTFCVFFSVRATQLPEKRSTKL